MSLKSFSLKMFQHCPLFSAFSPDDHLRAFEQFMEYKTRVPVRGAIMLNSAMDSAVLVKGYKKGASWSFPRGKINKDEPDLDCAIREVYEETGFDLHEARLVERNLPTDYLEVTLKDQQVRLFIFRDVPQETFFEPKTRKEIGDIKWYKLTDLPAYRKRKVAGKAQGNGTNSNDKFYMVAPFMVQLRQWILKQRKLDPRTAANGSKGLHSVVLEEEELTEDNMLDKPIVEQPVILDASAEYIDKATKELRDALLGPFSASRPKDVPPNSHSDAGQAILGLLRNSGVPENGPGRPAGESSWNGDFSRAPQHPITPLDHISTEAPQPHTPHHHQHATHRMPVNTYDRPPSFPVAPNADTTYMQHRQSRPEIQMTTDLRGLPTIQFAPRYYQDKPVQLLHPQPLPPQVQGDKLIQSMMTPPMIPDPNVRPPPNDTPQNRQNPAQAHHHGHGPHGAVPAPHQLPAHSLNLLNALKGDNQGAAPHTFQPPSNMQQGATTTSTQYQQSFFNTDRRGSGNQNGLQARPGHTNTLVTDKAQYSPQNYSVSPRIRSPNTSDKHRSALLEMFKKGESSVPQNQLDGQSAGMLSPRSAKPNDGQKPNQSPTTAETLRTAAREKKGPLEMNPETNLPYGALSILSRPQSGKTTNRRDSSTHRQDIGIGRRHTPTSPLAKGSPSYNSMQGQVSDTRGQWSSQPRPSLAQAYPYGTSQGTGTSPFSMLPSPPAASTFPMPGMLKPRQDSSSEHKNTLLSLFGKQKAGMEQQSKGKEAAGAELFTGGAAPRSRMASVASSRGDGLADKPTSRRGSQTPLSPADRNFLLGFLENKARQ